MAVTIKSEREIGLMRESCKILAEVHTKLSEAIKPGISTWEINELGDRLIQAMDVCQTSFIITAFQEEIPEGRGYCKSGCRAYLQGLSFGRGQNSCGRQDQSPGEKAD